MLVVSIDVKLLDHLTAKRSFRKHAPNGAFHHFDRVFLEHDAGGTGAETTIVSRNVVVVFLGLRMVAGEFHFRGIDDDDVVTAIKGRSVGGLVLAHEDDRDFGSQAAERDVGSINDVPIVLDSRSFRQRGLTLHSNFLSDN